jgi:glutathione S-transferase
VITNVGLLNPKEYDPQSKMQAYRLGVAAWAKSKTLQLNGLGRLTNVADDVIGALQGLLASKLGPDSLIPDVPLKSVAVWDTVGSLGIPEYVRSARADVLRFVDTELSKKVACGFHAMAIDELRADFPVTPWKARDGVTQRWFVGAHADVGGGYPSKESALSDLTLSWMIENLRGVGVRFAAAPIYKPDASTVLTQPIHTPWTNPPFDHLGRTPRDIAGVGGEIDATARQRWDSDANYRPDALRKVWAASP